MHSAARTSLLGLFAMILPLTWPLLAGADCSADQAQIKLALAPESLSIRNELFSRLCDRSKGELVDITDATLTGRLTKPTDIVFLNNRSGNPGELNGNLLLAFMVDLDGSLHDTTIIVGSGNKRLDEQTLEIWPYYRYKTPAMLDGRPVRILMYFRFKATTNPHDVPPHR
jgi:Gram-negative bacterial TonB protein C-terminal